jgi:hypothetical protein
MASLGVWDRGSEEMTLGSAHPSQAIYGTLLAFGRAGNKVTVVMKYLPLLLLAWGLA